LLRKAGGLAVEIDDDDESCWEAERAAQRGDLVVKVSALPSALPAAMAAAQELGATLVARAGLGLAWIQLDPTGALNRAYHGGARQSEPERPAEVDAAGAVAAIEELRRRLAPAPCVVLDAPTEVRAALDPWGGETGSIDLMGKVKARFDPAGICAPGLFVGGV
jgi:glycolate oxidase FAD binding subunit